MPRSPHPDHPATSATGALACLVALAALGTACTPPARQVAIIGQDYAFQAPATLPAGPATITFENHGAVAHELSIARLRPGITMDSALAGVRAGATPDSFIDGTVGILVARPGHPSLGALHVDLAAGRTYALVCQFQDAPDQPPHMAKGMIGSIRVE